MLLLSRINLHQLHGRTSIFIDEKPNSRNSKLKIFYQEELHKLTQSPPFFVDVRYHLTLSVLKSEAPHSLDCYTVKLEI